MLSFLCLHFSWMTLRNQVLFSRSIHTLSLHLVYFCPFYPFTSHFPMLWTLPGCLFTSTWSKLCIDPPGWLFVLWSVSPCFFCDGSYICLSNTTLYGTSVSYISFITNMIVSNFKLLGCGVYSVLCYSEHPFYQLITLSIILNKSSTIFNVIFNDCSSKPTSNFPSSIGDSLAQINLPRIHVSLVFLVFFK